MHQQLFKDKENIGEILRHTMSVAENYFAKQETLAPGKYIEDIPHYNLPENGIGALETLDFFEKHYADKINNGAGPRYFGFVTGGSTPASVAGDWLVSTYDQNACGSNDSIAPQIENETIFYFKQLFGLDNDYFGTFVTGATMSNFVSLALGRQWVGEQHGIDTSNEGAGAFPVKVISGTPHASIVKSLSMLGIGRNAVVKIDTETQSESVDLIKLENYLQGHREPSILIANAGTVNTGDFDNLMAIGRLKIKYNFWMHVDAAFGGFAACSEKYQHLMEGINYADSVTIDAHKWLNVPYDAAMQFTRHKSLQLKVFQNSAVYLGDPKKSPDFYHYTPENSRRWRALPSWFSLMAYGKAGHREIVERNCSLARQLGAFIDQGQRFTLLQPVKLNMVCFTINHEELTFELIQKFLVAIRDHGKVFFTPTYYKGIPAIRAAISNWQTESKDIAITCEALTQVSEQILPTLNAAKI